MALHEAAHAVLAYHFGYNVTHLFLSVLGGEADYRFSELKRFRNNWKYLFRRGVIAEGGCAFVGQYLETGDEFDKKTVELIARELHALNPDGPSVTRLSDSIAKRAGQLCHRYRALIEHVACVLLDRGELDAGAFLAEIEHWKD